MRGKNSESDTIENFASNDSSVHELQLPSGTKELTTEDIVWLKEFFAELEVVEDE